MLFLPAEIKCEQEDRKTDKLERYPVREQFYQVDVACVEIGCYFRAFGRYDFFKFLLHHTHKWFADDINVQFYAGVSAYIVQIVGAYGHLVAISNCHLSVKNILVIFV